MLTTTMSGFWVRKRKPRTRSSSSRSKANSRRGFSSSRKDLHLSRSRSSLRSRSFFCDFACLASLSIRLSMRTRSLRTNSVSTALRSRTGSTALSGCGTLSSVNARTTTSRASAARAVPRNWLLNPCRPSSETWSPAKVEVFDGGGGRFLRAEERGQPVQTLVGDLDHGPALLAVARGKRGARTSLRPGQGFEKLRLPREGQTDDTDLHLDHPMLMMFRAGQGPSRQRSHYRREPRKSQTLGAAKDQSRVTSV